MSRAFVGGYRAGLQTKDVSLSMSKAIELMEVGFTYDIDDPVALASWEQNIFKFSALRAAYESEEVNKLFRSATSREQFIRAVEEQFGVKNRAWMETEYNTSYAIGESAATYRRLMGSIDTFPYWEIRTVLPLPNVRPHHEILHGRVLPAGHYIFNSLWPPFDWGCRCYIVPRLAGEIDETKVASDLAFVQNYIDQSPAWQKTRDKGFGRNPALNNEVFSDQQMYGTDPNRVIKKAGGLGAILWGLLALQEAQANSTSTDSGSPPELVEGDYAGRSTGELRDLTAQSPDEVWVTDGEYNYIKHYTDRSEISSYEVDKEDGTLHITNTGTATEADRTGLLVYSSYLNEDGQ